MAGLKPRLMETSEAGAVLALIQRSFTSMEGRIDPPSSMHRLDIAAVLDQAANGEVWLLGNAPDGVVFLTPKTGCLYLGKLAIRKVRRGAGLARVLVEHAMTRARALGFDAVELQIRVELVENHDAFRAMGFHKTAETAHAGYDRVTAYTFQRRVSSSPLP